MIRCDYCNSVVKPHAYRRHLEFNHASETDVTMLPPQQIPAKRTKTTNVKVKNRETSPSPLPDSTELIMDTSCSPTPVVVCSVPAIATVSAPSYSPKVSNSSSFSSSKASSNSSSSASSQDSNSVLANQPRRKSPNVNVSINISSDRKSQKSRDKDKDKEKDKDVDSDKHTSTDESKPACSKQTNCKTSSSTSRRSVGRTKEFTKLVAEHRAAKDSTANVVVSGKTTTTLQSLLKPVSIIFYGCL